MRILLIALALTAACNQSRAPAQPERAAVGPRATCGALCGATIECSNAGPTTCRYCNRGFCSSTPFNPEPPGGDLDAGITSP